MVSSMAVRGVKFRNFIIQFLAKSANSELISRKSFFQNFFPKGTPFESEPKKYFLEGYDE